MFTSSSCEPVQVSHAWQGSHCRNDGKRAVGFLSRKAPLPCSCSSSLLLRHSVFYLLFSVLLMILAPIVVSDRLWRTHRTMSAAAKKNLESVFCIDCANQADFASPPPIIPELTICVINLEIGAYAAQGSLGPRLWGPEALAVAELSLLIAKFLMHEY